MVGLVHTKTQRREGKAGLRVERLATWFGPAGEVRREWGGVVGVGRGRRGFLSLKRPDHEVVGPPGGAEESLMLKCLMTNEEDLI